MPATYLYPSTVDMTEIDQQKLPASMENDLLLGPNGILPPKNKDAHIIQWEQRDNYIGLMAVRGMGGEPQRVAPIGAKRYMMTPGVYGEFSEVEELEITERRRIGSVNDPIDITDLTLERGEQLLDRQNSRMKKIGWDLLTLGAFSSTNAAGAIVHTDSYRQRIFSAIVPWATSATSTPLQDFRAVKLLARGYSMTLGNGAKAYMNQTTFNNFIANTNQSDLAGRRTAGLAQVLSLEMANSLLAGEDLPEIVICEDGYIDDNGVFQLYLMTSTVIVVGRRANGVKVGEWLWTRNATNPGAAPGPYVWIEEQLRPPHKVLVHRGFNGGTALYFPSAIIVMKV